jgi:dienelactone hydrolase
MRRLEERARNAGKAIEFRYYEGARHGFAVRTHPGFDAPTAKTSFEEAHRFIDARFRP